VDGNIPEESPLRSALLLSLLALAVPARADVRWIGGFDNDDLKQWGAIHCGGQGGSCPCMAPFWDPSWQTNYGSGSCDATNSNTPLSLGASNGRFQIVSPPPGAENAGKALRVELKNGDLWPCASGCGWATNRNELVYSKDSGTTAPTAYGPGDNRYFSWSSYFTAGFSSWSCNDSLDPTGRDTDCPGGVPGPYYNPWNVVTQFHHNTDSGVPPIAMALRPSKTVRNGYALVLMLGLGGVDDTELWRQDLSVQSWYDFVLHLGFAKDATGVVEFWVGRDGGPKTKQLLNCPGGAATTCRAATLYSDGADFLVQGLYRNPSLLDDSVIFQKGMIDGDTFADVTADFSLAVSPAVTVSGGQSASYTIQTAASAGAARNIALSASGLPPGVTSAILNPPSVLAGGSSVLTLITDPAANGLSATFTVSGQYPGGSPGHTAAGGININAAPKLVATLVDSFGGSSIDSSLWSVSTYQGSATERDGALLLAPYSYSSWSQMAVESRGTYALTGSSATVRVPSVVSQACGANNRFLLKSDARNSVGFWVECGTLYAYAQVNGALSFPGSSGWSGLADLYWRIRESAGQVYWETSPDKASWTQRASMTSASLFDLTALKVGFYVEEYASLPNPGVARYANLNN
jgi:hypothetical protein